MWSADEHVVWSQPTCGDQNTQSPTSRNEQKICKTERFYSKEKITFALKMIEMNQHEPHCRLVLSHLNTLAQKIVVYQPIYGPIVQEMKSSGRMSLQLCRCYCALYPTHSQRYWFEISHLFLLFSLFFVFFLLVQ